MQKVQELRQYLTQDVRFFLKMVESDSPKIDAKLRDPFINPLRKKSGTEDGSTPGELPPPPPPEGDPEPIQRDKMHRMGELLALVQHSLAAGNEDDALEKYEEFKKLYEDVEVGRITIKEFKDQMIETWKLAQDRVYPRLRQIQLRRFKEEARTALDKLYDDYRKQDIEAARQHNTEIVKILDPKLKSKDDEFKKEAGIFDKERAQVFERVKVLEEFYKNVKPFMKLTATITSPQINVALIETVFGGELVKSSVELTRDDMEKGKSKVLPGMTGFSLVRIEEDLIIADYKGEQVEVHLGGDFAAQAPKQSP
jgi:hypothetical protein